MKSKLLLVLILVSFSFADILEDFKNKNYKKVCNVININKTDDEKILSIIGFSCLKTDDLYLLPCIVRKLKRTKIGRLNSIYFSTIYLQKKLLYSYFFDNFDLSSFSLPSTDYILSIVFEKIINGDYEKKGKFYIIKYKSEVIKVYKKGNKLFVDEYQDNNLIKRHYYR